MIPEPYISIMSLEILGILVEIASIIQIFIDRKREVKK